MISEYKESIREKSKILKNSKEQFLDELEEGFDKIIKKKKNSMAHISSSLLEHLKKMTPSQIGYEIKKYTFGKF